MRKIQIILCLLFVIFETKAQTEKVLKINAHTEVFSLLGSAEVLADSTGKITFEDIRNSETNEFNNAFFPADSPKLNASCDVHWVRFSLWNESLNEENYKISVTFTDKLEVYVPTAGGEYLQKTTGDLMPIEEREVPVGQMLFTNLQVPANQAFIFYLRMETQSKITRQHKGVALRSLKVFRKKDFMILILLPDTIRHFFMELFLLCFFIICSFIFPSKALVICIMSFFY